MLLSMPLKDNIGPFSFPSAVWLKTTSKITCQAKDEKIIGYGKVKLEYPPTTNHLNSSFMGFPNKSFEFVYCITTTVSHASKWISQHWWEIIDCGVAPEIQPEWNIKLCKDKNSKCQDNANIWSRRMKKILAMDDEPRMYKYHVVRQYN